MNKILKNNIFKPTNLKYEREKSVNVGSYTRTEREGNIM